MDTNTSSAEPIVFVFTQFKPRQPCLASIVSSHRCIDVTLIHTAWTVKTCSQHPIDLSCQTIPLETVSYAHPTPYERPSERDLIRLSGQNQTKLRLSPTDKKLELPLFLTTGQPEPVYHYNVEVRLLT
jgi:hypothetical protein